MNAFPERYDTAVKVAKESLLNYDAGKKGDVSDFYPENAYKNAGITWVIKKLKTNAESLDVVVANKLRNYSKD